MTPQKSNMRKVLGLRLFVLLAVSALLSYSLRQQWNTVNTNTMDVLEKRDTESRDDISHATGGGDGSFDVEPATNENDDLNDYNDNDVDAGGDNNVNALNGGREEESMGHAEDHNDVHKDNFDDGDGDTNGDEANVGKSEATPERNDEVVVENQRSDDENDSSYVYDENDDDIHSNPELNLLENGVMKEEGFDIENIPDTNNVISETDDNEESDIGKDNTDGDGVGMTPNDKTLGSFGLNTNDDRDEKIRGSVDPWTVPNANNGFGKEIDVENAEGQFRDMNRDDVEAPDEQSFVTGPRFGASDIKTNVPSLLRERGEGEVDARVSVTEKNEEEEEEKGQEKGKEEEGESVQSGLEAGKSLAGNDQNSGREDGGATRIEASLSDRPVDKGYAMGYDFGKSVLADGDQVPNVGQNNQIRKAEAVLNSVGGTDNWSKYRNRVLDYLLLGQFDKSKINPRLEDIYIDTIDTVSGFKPPEGIRDNQVPIVSPVIDPMNKPTNTFDLIDWALLSHGKNDSDVNGNDTNSSIDDENDGEKNLFENRVDDKAILAEKVHNTMGSPGEMIHNEFDINTQINPEAIQGIITDDAQERVLVNNNMPNMDDRVKAAWIKSNIREQGIDSRVDASSYGSLSSIKQVKDDGGLGVNIDRNYIPRQYPPIPDNNKLNGHSLFESPGLYGVGGFNIKQSNPDNNVVPVGDINEDNVLNADHTFTGKQRNMNSLLGVVAKTQNIQKNAKTIMPYETTPNMVKLENQVKSAHVLTEQENRQLSGQFGNIKTSQNGVKTGDSYIGVNSHDAGYIPHRSILNKNLNDYPIFQAPGFDEFRGFDIKYTDGDKKTAKGIDNVQNQGFKTLPIFSKFQKYESPLAERDPDKPKFNNGQNIADTALSKGVTVDAVTIDELDNNNVHDNDDQIDGDDGQESIAQGTNQTVTTPGNPETNYASKEQQTAEINVELMTQQQNGNPEPSLKFKGEATDIEATNDARNTDGGRPETEVSGYPGMKSPGYFSRSLLSFFRDELHVFNEDPEEADGIEGGGDGIDTRVGGDGATEPYSHKISTGEELDNEQREDSQSQIPNENTGYETGDNYEGGGDGIDAGADDDEGKETYPYADISTGQEADNEHREESQTPGVNDGYNTGDDYEPSDYTFQNEAVENVKGQVDITGLNHRFNNANDEVINDYDNNNNIIQPGPKQTTPNNNGGSYDNPRPLTQDEYNALHTLPYRQKPMTTEPLSKDGEGKGHDENQDIFIEKKEDLAALNQNHNLIIQPPVNNYFQDPNNQHDEPFQDLKNEPNSFENENDERKMMELLMNEKSLQRGENRMVVGNDELSYGDENEMVSEDNFFNDPRQESDTDMIFLDEEGERGATLPRLSNCPINLELSPVAHAVTALVVFPGALADWLTNAIEQITGEPSDSLYNVIASLKAEDTSRFFQMPRRSVIQTHSAQSRDFDKAILIINNPLAVEKKHLQFLPFAFEWRRYFLWDDTMISWLSSDVPLLVMTADDLIADPETQLRKIASFLNIDDAIVDASLTCAMLQKPPILIDDVTKISGVYSGDRRRMSRSIDEVIEIASRKAPDILHRLFQYKTLLYI